MLVGQAGVAGVASRAEEDEEGSVLLSGAICLKLSSDVKQVQISLHLADPPWPMWRGVCQQAVLFSFNNKLLSN
jgi:hypothetical protein